MTWDHRIHTAIRHVRTHLDQDLTVPALARIAHASPFHFGRLFKAHTGETLHRFVRRARVERAAQLMVASPDLELAEIAVRVGLGASSQFSRVFKQIYGIAPSRWDRTSRLTPGIDGFEDALASAGTPLPAVRTRSRPAERVASVRVRTPFFDNELLESGLQRLRTWAVANGLDPDTLALRGMSWDNPDTTPIDQVCFDLGWVLPDSVPTPRDLPVHHIPAATWAEARIEGSKLVIAQAWEALYRWLAEHDVDPADQPGLKRFEGRPEQHGWDVYALTCCIALQ